MSSTALVVPCYNEADRLSLSGFHEFLDRHSDFRCVMVDDGSTDTSLVSSTRTLLRPYERPWTCGPYWTHGRLSLL